MSVRSPAVVPFSAVALAAVLAAAAAAQGPSPAPLRDATATVRDVRTAASVTGGAPSQHRVEPDTLLKVGTSAISAANSASSPFASSAGAHIALSEPTPDTVRLVLTAGAINDGLGAPPFHPLYREGRVDVDVLLRLPGARGRQWSVDARALLQATFGAGIGTTQVQIDVGDDGTAEIVWGCMTPQHQQVVTGTALEAGLPIRVRVTGEARSWTTSTPDHFLAQLALECTYVAKTDVGLHVAPRVAHRLLFLAAGMRGASSRALLCELHNQERGFDPCPRNRVA